MTTISTSEHNRKRKRSRSALLGSSRGSGRSKSPSEERPRKRHKSNYNDKSNNHAEKTKKRRMNERLIQENAIEKKHLPIEDYKEEIMNLILKNDCVVVTGETGSGKSTQLSQFLYAAGFRNICVTQPRRVGATSLSLRVSQEMGCKLGNLVGYRIRFSDCTNEHTQICYMTDGILLREVLHDKLLRRYDCVILDEAHERSLQTDILFAILRDIVLQRKQTASEHAKPFKLLVTSATLDVNKFSKFSVFVLLEIITVNGANKTQTQILF
ncbi:hypothetical protein RFI_07872 [Reticulomyxa filosa]|uniref:Helicase ATP-binding domain-containing protein n=1 Tax=Reticulomyxa filosa TaxID=46433 RepID=X6NTY3_RETFI|nr:hypothetical protein RFI_07872 [Reticulomyxa filosa]|eukprot:ETO29249.1 hypothetical protein RFI_07872 [Reticulomyxa filosa]